jgi:hypothetical protein
MFSKPIRYPYAFGRRCSALFCQAVEWASAGNLALRAGNLVGIRSGPLCGSLRSTTQQENATRTVARVLQTALATPGPATSNFSVFTHLS